MIYGRTYVGVMSEARAVRSLAFDARLKPLTRVCLVLCWTFRQRNQRSATCHHASTYALYPVYATQPVVKPVVQPAVQLYSRLDNRLYRVNGALGPHLYCSGAFYKVCLICFDTRTRGAPYWTTLGMYKNSRRHFAGIRGVCSISASKQQTI